MSNHSFPPDPTGTSALSTDERRAIAPELLLDRNLAWEKYKLPVVAGVALLVLALVGSEIYQGSQEKAAAAAGAILDTAKTEPEYQKVIDTYPGSQAAANAYLLLGRARADAKNFAGAAQAWQTFVEKFPQHPLVPTALIGEGTALEAQGKMDEARALYQRVATSYQNSYAAPLARLSEAGLLLAQRKPGDAKHIYEDLVATSPKSFAAQIAKQSLNTFNELPPLVGNPTSSTSSAPGASPSAAVVPEAVPLVAAPNPAAPVPESAPVPAASVAPSVPPTATP